MIERYCIVDVETEGCIAGLHSMLSLATVLVDEKGAILSRYGVNLAPLADLTPDPNTMEWWAKHPEAYAATVCDQHAPAEAIAHYLAWLDYWGREVELVFVADPAAFDAPFVRYYCWRFGGRDPFGHGALDLKTLYMALFNAPYSQSRSSNRHLIVQPTERGLPHTALADALAEAHTFIVLLNKLHEQHWNQTRLPSIRQLLQPGMV